MWCSTLCKCLQTPQNIINKLKLEQLRNSNSSKCKHSFLNFRKLIIFNFGFCTKLTCALLHNWSDKGFKVIVVNQILAFLLGGAIEHYAYSPFYSRARELPGFECFLHHIIHRFSVPFHPCDIDNYNTSLQVHYI